MALGLPRPIFGSFVWLPTEITTFLTIFRRFPTTFRRFSKIVPKARRTFPIIFRKFPKISEDFWGRPEDVSVIHQRILSTTLETNLISEKSSISSQVGISYLYITCEDIVYSMPLGIPLTFILYLAFCCSFCWFLCCHCCCVGFIFAHWQSRQLKGF